MTSRFEVFIATSLDGYISRPDGAIDWLDQANASASDGEDCGYAAFMRDVDVLVMGRHTFEKVMTFDAWPYGDLDVRVMSRSMRVLPSPLPPTVTLTSESPDALAATLRAEGSARHMLMAAN